ncbi:16174_t:CDS:2, partial [Acaulospora colombiana]
PVQNRLRQELRTVQTDSPTMEQLNSLPYLDAVVREILRYDPVVTGAIRVATQDDVIPLETSFVDGSGNTRDSIRQVILAHALSKLIWGEDAKEFKRRRLILAYGETNLRSSEVHAHNESPALRAHSEL